MPYAPLKAADYLSHRKQTKKKGQCCKHSWISNKHASGYRHHLGFYENGNEQCQILALNTRVIVFRYVMPFIAVECNLCFEGIASSIVGEEGSAAGDIWYIYTEGRRGSLKSMIMHSLVPQKKGNFLSGWETVSPKIQSVYTWRTFTFRATVNIPGKIYSNLYSSHGACAK